MKVYAMKINFTQLTSIMHFMLVLSNEDEITDSEIPLFWKFLAPFRLTKEQEQNILEKSWAIDSEVAAEHISNLDEDTKQEVVNLLFDVMTRMDARRILKQNCSLKLPTVADSLRLTHRNCRIG